MESFFESFAGKLLLAMPRMGDPRFEAAVIYICSHSQDGAMGLIINKRAEGLDFSDLLDQLDVPKASNVSDVEIYFGGPVESGRGLILHSADYSDDESTLVVDDQFSMTATLDILEDIAQGNGPNTALLALGYAGWAPYQLESEILQNGWLICDAEPQLVFHIDAKDKWLAGMTRLGINPLMLSADAGRA